MPTLLLDKTICLRNIERMALKAKENKLSFRPHCKTHQSIEIASWFREFGVSKITVSSFFMARKFAEAGWEDILVAFPFNRADRMTLDNISGAAKISILLDSSETLPFLEGLKHEIGFYIDIDTGYGRTGIKAEDPEAIDALLSAAMKNPRLQFMGFYCHAGHSYKASPSGINMIHQKAKRDLNTLKKQFATYSPLALYGDTPSCSNQIDFKGIDELTPGNFVFYDLTQETLGSCPKEDIAVALSCIVTGKYADRRQLVIHGGGVHFSKESLQINGHTVYGRLVTPAAEGWTFPVENTYVTSLSQEHGVLKNCGSIFEHTQIGASLLFLPVHSCMTANLMREYHISDGDTILSINN